MGQAERPLVRASVEMLGGSAEATPNWRCYLPFFAPAFTALALLLASFFFWFLFAESCFLALSLAFGDLSPMVLTAFAEV